MAIGCWIRRKPQRTQNGGAHRPGRSSYRVSRLGASQPLFPAPTLTARPLVFFRRKRGAPAVVPERRRPRHGRPSPAHQRAPTGEVGERIGKGMKLGLRPIRCFRLFREYSNFPYIHRLRIFRILLSIEDQLRKVLFHRRYNKSADQFTNAHAPELSLER